MKKYIFPSLLSINVLVSVVVLIWLLLIPADPKNAVFLGYSASRLAMVVGVFILFLFFIVGLFYKNIPGLKIANLINPFFLPLYFLLVITSLVSGFFIAFPPPDLISNNGAMYFRAMPLFVLLSIVCTQWSIALYALNTLQIKEKIQTTFQWLRNSKGLGIVLIFLSVIISILTIYFSYYNLSDEGDTITSGWLMANGWLLYQDIFSHHFPLSYLFVSAVLKLFPPTIFTVRISWILARAIIFLFTLLISRKYLSVGIIAVVWSIVGNFYLGNMLLYQSINAVFQSCLVVIFITVLNAKGTIPAWKIIGVGLLLGLAICNDPIAIFSSLLILLILILNGLFHNKGWSGLQQGIRQIKLVMIFPVIIGLTILFGFIFSHTLQDFIANVLVFNSTIYSKYSVMLSPARFFHQLSSGLEILNKIWLQETDLYFQWSDFAVLDRWLFTGFFFRLSIVVASLYLVMQKKFLTGLFVILLSTIASARASIYFHASGFIAISITIAILFILGDLDFSKQANQNKGFAKGFVSFGNGLFIIAKVSLFFILCVLVTRFTNYYSQHPDKLIYEQVFKNDLMMVNHIKDSVCYSPNAKVLIYPINPIIYFLTQLEPASKHIFMLPWNAEIGQYQVIHDLEDKPVLVYIDEINDIWGRPNAKFMSIIITYLKKNFIQTDDGYYISQDLSLICQSGFSPH